MTRANLVNIAASVHQKLLNVAHAENLDFQKVLGEYAAQRTLWRLERAGLQDALIFKGGRLLNVWLGRFRSTRDIDFSSRKQLDETALRDLFMRVCEITSDDGLHFDVSTIQIEAIRAQQTFQGLRLTMYSYLDHARIPLQIDIGFSPRKSPGEHLEEIPSIIDKPSAKILAYSRHAVIGEKMLAAVTHGEYNSRMKDFYDIAMLSRQYDFTGADMASGLRNAFTHENIVPAVFKLDIHMGGARWKAFLRKSAAREVCTFERICLEIEYFINPLLAAMQQGEEQCLFWRAGGSWAKKAMRGAPL